jgi:uncharacterized membrane protein
VDSIKPIYAYILIAAGLGLIILSLAILTAATTKQQGEAFAIILIGPIPLVLSGDGQLMLLVISGVLALIILLFLVLLRRSQGA